MLMLQALALCQPLNSLSTQLINYPAIAPQFRYKLNPFIHNE